MSLNVFKDLGFDDGYAAEMDLRVAVAVQIHNLIKAQGRTQQEASRFFGVPQPTISKIMRLNLERISLALLLRMLFKSGTPFAIDFGGDAESIFAKVSPSRSATQVVLSEWDMGEASALPASSAQVGSEGTTEPGVWHPSAAGTGR